MDNMEKLKSKQLNRLLLDFEGQLRAKAKYTDPNETTWEEVRDWYYQIRNEYMVIDLMELEEFDG